MNWHKLRMGQLDAPTIRLIRKASRNKITEGLFNVFIKREVFYRKRE